MPPTGRLPRCSWSTPSVGRSASCTYTTCCVPGSSEPREATAVMAIPPIPARSAASARAGRDLIAGIGGPRRRARAADLARRRHMILLAKWILPATALVLLGTLAVWPEVKQIEAGARSAATKFSADVAAARVTEAEYHSVDIHGRPYTLTA